MLSAKDIKARKESISVKLRTYTEEQKQLAIQLFTHGKTYDEVCRIAEIPIGVASRIRATIDKKTFEKVKASRSLRTRAKNKKSVRLCGLSRSEAIKMLLEGKKYSQIIKALNTKKNEIARVVSSLDDATKKEIYKARGIKKVIFKEEVTRLLLSGLRDCDICRETGCSYNVIDNIRKSLPEGVRKKIKSAKKNC